MIGTLVYAIQSRIRRLIWEEFRFYRGKPGNISFMVNHDTKGSYKDLWEEQGLLPIAFRMCLTRVQYIWLMRPDIAYLLFGQYVKRWRKTKPKNGFRIYSINYYKRCSRWTTRKRLIRGTMSAWAVFSMMKYTRLGSSKSGLHYTSPKFQIKIPIIWIRLLQQEKLTITSNFRKKTSLSKKSVLKVTS